MGRNAALAELLPEPDFEERRKNRRFGMEHRGHLILRAFHTGVECYVTNISSTGAHVELAEEVPVQSAYMLHLPGADDYLTAKTVWQNGRDVGLEFSSRPTLNWSR